jgi:hypothetical protein
MEQVLYRKVILINNLPEYNHIGSNGKSKIASRLINNTKSLQIDQEASEKELKWNLFGPYSTHHVRFSSQQVLLVSDSLASKLSRPLSSRGIRLVRGYPADPVVQETETKVSTSEIADQADYQPSTGDTQAEMKQMSRLIFVVHGYVRALK